LYKNFRSAMNRKSLISKFIFVYVKSNDMATVRNVLVTEESVICDAWLDTLSAVERGHARTDIHTHTSTQYNEFFLSEFIKKVPSYGLKSASVSRKNACHP
jgi:hypothetical protein